MSFEEYYNMQMQGRLPPGMPGNMENFRGMPGPNLQGVHNGKQVQKDKTAPKSIPDQNIPNGVSVNIFFLFSIEFKG